MNCPFCNRTMILDGDSFICHYCEFGININWKKADECEHDDISFGVNNLAYCYDCGNLIAYENSSNSSKKEK